MSEQQKRYTAEDFRKAATEVCETPFTNPFYPMLRQAADAEEERAALKGDRNGILKANNSLARYNDRLRDENAKLKARLEAVVKKLEDMRNYCVFDCVDREDVDAILSILQSGDAS